MNRVNKIILFLMPLMFANCNDTVLERSISLSGYEYYVIDLPGNNKDTIHLEGYTRESFIQGNRKYQRDVLYYSSDNCDGTLSKQYLLCDFVTENGEKGIDVNFTIGKSSGFCLHFHGNQVFKPNDGKDTFEVDNLYKNDEPISISKLKFSRKKGLISYMVDSTEYAFWLSSK